MKFSDLNCVVAAIHALTDASPNLIIAGIAASAEGDELAFDKDGYACRLAWVRFLERTGWRIRWATAESPLQTIPLSCIVLFDGHAFCIRRGVLWDTGSGVREGKQILAIIEPPAAAGNEPSK